MNRRTVVFFGGFFAIVAGPQVAFHLARYAGWIPKRDLTWTTEAAKPAIAFHASDTLLAVRDGRFANRAAVFGAAYDPSLVIDLKARMPDGPLASARAAEMAVLPPTSSMVVARFATADEAKRAADTYLRLMSGAEPRRTPQGWLMVTRASDVVSAIVADSTMVVWTGPDSATVADAITTSPLVARASSESRDANDPAPDFWLYRPIVLVSITLLLVMIAVLWFFHMAPWAAEVAASSDAAPVSLAEMRQRLLQVNALDTPFSIAPLEGDDDVLVASWRYADATWIDFARARGMHRTHRIVLRLDADRAMVRPTDQNATIDWSAGRGGGDLSWRSERGIVFVQREQEVVFGLQLDDRGRLTRQLSYTYRFDLQEMKAPLIQAVTRAGWRWRPALLHGPRWLRWLTG